MDCKRFRKYIGAFADGELDVEQNLNALEHLNMCPACTARVSEVNAIRESLQRGYGQIEAPPQLRAKIEAIARDDHGTQDAGKGRPRQTIRIFVRLAAVASLLLVLAVWRPWTTRPTSILLAPDLSAQLVTDARTQHRDCVWYRGANHQSDTLPRDPESIVSVLRQEFGIRVAVPDLGTQGYELVGVDRCGIGQRKGSHALYRSGEPNGELSFFTIERKAMLASDRFAVSKANERIPADNDRLSIVAWHDGPQTYVACAEVPESELADIARSIRIQLARAKTTPRTALAMIK